MPKPWVTPVVLSPKGSPVMAVGSSKVEVLGTDGPGGGITGVVDKGIGVSASMTIGSSTVIPSGDVGWRAAAALPAGAVFDEETTPEGAGATTVGGTEAVAGAKTSGRAGAVGRAEAVGGAETVGATAAGGPADGIAVTAAAWTAVDHDAVLRSSTGGRIVVVVAASGAGAATSGDECGPVARVFFTTMGAAACAALVAVDAAAVVKVVAGVTTFACAGAEVGTGVGAGPAVVGAGTEVVVTRGVVLDADEVGSEVGDAWGVGEGTTLEIAVVLAVVGDSWRGAGGAACRPLDERSGLLHCDPLALSRCACISLAARTRLMNAFSLGGRGDEVVSAAPKVAAADGGWPFWGTDGVLCVPDGGIPPTPAIAINRGSQGCGSGRGGSTACGD